MARGKGSRSGGGGDGIGDGGVRREAERVRTARRRKIGSTRWLQRQLNDPYVIQAKKDGYRSRAAYKLRQIDDKFELLQPGQRVVDLGAAPGGWTQIALERVQPEQSGGRVIAFDITEIAPIGGAIVVQGDLFDDDAPAALRDAIDGQADVVLCDMAAPATGHAPTDHLRTMTLGEGALEFACEVLAPGGAFVVKVLQGADEPALFAAMRARFGGARRMKPAASRSDSTELYLIATGFKGAE
ncbi:MAG: 23S rRNA methyltransferase [Alphaproteobacteria bacterium]|nr:23S rRNA methyltransferase [Alphaproteobacteria bacterium]